MNKRGKMDWDREAEMKFKRMIVMVPLTYRKKAEVHAVLKAEEIALSRGASSVEECDIVTAFVSETPDYLQPWMRQKAKKAGFDIDAAEQSYA